MREILFRAKAAHTIDHEWLYGYVCAAPWEPEGIMIICVIDDDHAGGDAVIPETVGQFTGLTDKNGKKIFEGDIVICGVRSTIGVVTFGVGSFDSGIYRYIGWHVKESDGRVDMNELYAYDEYSPIEVIGNIYDNPELLKEDTYEENPDAV